jgi:hypothetical protein
VPLGTAQSLYQRRFDTLTSDFHAEQGRPANSKDPTPHEKLLASDGTRVVTIDVAPSAARQATFSLKTTPHDPTVHALLEQTLRPLLSKLAAGAPGVKIHDERRVDAWLNVMSLRSGTYGLHFRCEQPASGELHAAITLELAADATFTVATDVTDAQVRDCVSRYVTKSLKDAKLRRNAPTTITTTTYLKPPGYRDERSGFDGDD